jgi:putative spermidine/putrescine transport system substrate-binding protein
MNRPYTHLSGPPLVHILSLILFMGTAASAVGATRSLEGQQIVLYTSGGTQLETTRELVIKPFEDETGAKVIVDDSCCQRLQAAMQAGEYLGDVLIGIDRAALLARDNLGYFVHDPRLEKIARDLGSPEPLPSSAMMILNTYSYVIAARDSTVPLPKSWEEFWDSTRFPGSRGINRTVPQVQLEAALLADGVPKDQLYPLDIDRALKKLSALRETTKLTLNASGADQINNLGTGETTYALVYSNRAYLAKRDGIGINFSFSDGFIEGNGGALLKGSRNIDGAVALLAYHMRPEVLARFAERTGMAPAYPAAAELIAPEFRPLMATTPENMKLQHLLNDDYWQKNLSVISERWIGWIAN